MSPDDTSHRTTTRRALLGAVGLFGTGALAGCTGASGGDDPQGTAEMPARLRLEDASAPDCEDADPIVFADLSAGERDLVETALEAGEYTASTDEAPPAFERLRERAEARTDACGELVVYLERDGTYYRVALVNGDNIVASTRVTPDGG